MKKILVVVSIALILSIGISAHALTKGFSANSFIPAVDDSPYITLYGSPSLKFGKFVEATSVTYAYRPLQLTQGGSRTQGVLDQTFIQNFSFAMGLPDDHMQLGLLIPVAWVLNYKNPQIAGAQGKNETALGELGPLQPITVLRIPENLSLSTSKATEMRGQVADNYQMTPLQKIR